MRLFFHLKTFFFHLNFNLGSLKCFIDSKFEEYDSFLALGIVSWYGRRFLCGLGESWLLHPASRGRVAHFGVHAVVVAVTPRPRGQPESFGGICNCASLTWGQLSQHLRVQKRPKQMELKKVKYRPPHKQIGSLGAAHPPSLSFLWPPLRLPGT